MTPPPVPRTSLGFCHPGRQQTRQLLEHTMRRCFGLRFESIALRACRQRAQRLDQGSAHELLLQMDKYLCARQSSNTARNAKYGCASCNLKQGLNVFKDLPCTVTLSRPATPSAQAAPSTGDPQEPHWRACEPVSTPSPCHFGSVPFVSERSEAPSPPCLALSGAPAAGAWQCPRNALVKVVLTPPVQSIAGK